MKYLLLILLFVLPAAAAHAQDTPTIHKLKEVEVLSDLGKYKRDSALMDTIYRKAFNDANRKVEFGLSNGFVVSGLFSQLARTISGRKKRDKKFLATYQATQAEKLIAIRYNKAIVTAVTGLQGDDAAHFMNANPMPLAFARTATDLELQMWIRYNYKRWKSKQP